jgi:hypothetical protein
MRFRILAIAALALLPACETVGNIAGVLAGNGPGTYSQSLQDAQFFICQAYTAGATTATPLVPKMTPEQRKLTAVASDTANAICQSGLTDPALILKAAESVKTINSIKAGVQ